MIRKNASSIGRRPARLLSEAASGESGLPLAPETTKWDATDARLKIAKWASSDGSGDVAKVNWGKYRKAFLWYDDSKPEGLGSYKLPKRFAALSALAGGQVSFMHSNIETRPPKPAQKPEQKPPSLSGTLLEGTGKHRL